MFVRITKRLMGAEIETPFNFYGQGLAIVTAMRMNRHSGASMVCVPGNGK
jgi:hypothetical protein